MTKLTISVRRVRELLDDAGGRDGEWRVLVDRLWPRGIKKERLAHDDWDKAVAPSTDLRRAFHGGDLDFDAFAEAYREELDASGAARELLDRAKEAGVHELVLVSDNKDDDHNHARVLQAVLESA